jgi:biotin carboxyl carrier protein
MPKYYIPTDGDEDPRTFEVETLEDGRYKVVTPDDEELIVDAFEPERGHLHLLEGGRSWDLHYKNDDNDWAVGVDGQAHTMEVLNERQRRMRVAGVGGRGASGPELVSPMAGTVVSIVAEPGTEVEKGETVVIVEAMKMENGLKAHRDGTVDEVKVEPGDNVEIDDVLVTIVD